jgi:hypothetical protein
MTEHESDDRPWTEEQWERFMQAADARSAKFGELMETLIDHPERDEIVAHEMGWDRSKSGSGEIDESWFAEDKSEEEDLDDDMDDDIDDDDIDEIVRRGRDEMESIEAYAASYRWSMKVHEELKPLFDRDDDVLLEEDLDRALRSFEVAAKIAGGHGMGYEDDVLCGNIVCCKKSLAAADEALEGLEAIQARDEAAGIPIGDLIVEGRHARSLVAERIEELRSRVWWA